MRKYGWPIVLFMVVPFIALYVRALYFYALDSGFFTHDSILPPTALWNLTTAALLSVFYLWVRNDERATLRLVWSCTLVLATVSALSFLCAVLVGYDSLASAYVVSTLNGLVELVILLWFARRASVSGLSHAFFLVVVAGGLWIPDLPESLPFYFEWLWKLAEGVLAVWLLANFDLRSHAFRIRSVIVFVALNGLGVLSGLVLVSSGVAMGRYAVDAPYAFLQVAMSVLSFLLPLLFVYLVRVRHPQTKVLPATPREEC